MAALPQGGFESEAAVHDLAWSERLRWHAATLPRKRVPCYVQAMTQKPSGLTDSTETSASGSWPKLVHKRWNLIAFLPGEWWVPLVLPWRPGDVGRSAAGSVRVVLPHASVSRQHATLSFENGAPAIRALASSKNGVILDGNRLAADSVTRLAHGSVLELGDVVAVVEEGDRIPDSESSVIPRYVGRSSAVRRLSEQVASLPASGAVLVRGATGVGKEMIARAIHDRSPRSGKAYEAHNLASISSELLKSALFGHGKGSFSGAVADTKGYFGEAHGGTLFLDEFGEISPVMQVALLRAIELGQIEGVGRRVQQVDVRVIAATNKDLEGAITRGEFRRDLFERFPEVVRVPALQKRRSDIPLLVGELEPQLRLESGALGRLLRHPWTGNVRELKRVAAALSKLGRDALPEDVEDLLDVSKDAVDPGPVPLKPIEVQTPEEQFRDALRRTRGNVTEAASLLKKSLATFKRRLAKYGIDPEHFRL